MWNRLTAQCATNCSTARSLYTLTGAKILIERWRREYNTVRPHSALGYRPPAPKVISPAPLSGLMMSPALS